MFDLGVERLLADADGERAGARHRLHEGIHLGLQGICRVRRG